MKKSAYSEKREMIVAEAINPIATELRLLDPADLISLLRFECYGSIADLVSSVAELYYHPGTINFGAGGEYRLEWEGAPEIVLDLELKPHGATVYAQLILANEHAAVEINHVSFQNPSENPDENTEFLRQSLTAARFVPARQGEAA
ncbi:hypothetical protein [Rhizobium sp. AN83]|uniref:hypothetical protein n=1 Tax=Rhizobium sp. AN83 TaxID=3035217 RepID=UPI002B25D1B6|nr:hypothetical protein [Rhizobium sp. AN83]